MRTFFIFLSVFLGALVLLYPAFLNHYPLVYSDSGTYIDSGFRNYVPDDRPIVYGLFVRHCSLKESLFLSVLAQALLVSSGIFVCCRAFASSFFQSVKSYVVSIGLLAICSGLPWITSWIMPDICTGLSFVLLLVLMFATHQFSRWEIGILVVCYYFTTLSHLSNILSQLTVVAVLLTILLCIQKLRYSLIPAKKALLIILLVCSNYLILSLINLSFGRGFNTSKGSSVFLTAKLCGYGLLKDYLNHNCDHEHYKLCAYKDSLPESAPAFLWNYSGPLYQTGGWKTENVQELSKINSAILKQPVYLKTFIAQGLKGTVSQLVLFDAGHDFLAYDTTSAPYGAISWHLKKDRTFFVNSRQANGELGFNFNLLNHIQFYVFFLCLGLSVFLMLLKPFQKVDMAVLGAFVLIAGNAAACAFFSDAGNRYQLRVVWIAMLLTVIQAFAKKEQIKATLKCLHKNQLQ